ncbi:very short patch repair endonuclease [Lysobacter korlensis]|uniref:Very short patch repair endonuclease n=1 Tax=Lysobacter korlensis TaxID=553636 RepID=A0ABV6RT85_9GAMM
MDIISPEQRSALMSRVKGKDTKIELEVRRGLHALGFRFRLGDTYQVDGSKLPGRPDVVLPKFRTVVFVHGCFWHRHCCHLFRLPKTRTDFWEAKIAANQARDARKEAELRALGWNIETIWECQLRGQNADVKADAIGALANRIVSNAPK